MFRSLKKLDHWLDSHAVVWALLAIMAVLRLPNFFEPYWYGDEGIYLTIGTALRHGGILYHTIVDHKTPLIYYLAMVPNLATFRVLLFIFSSVSILGLYILAVRLLKSSISRALAGLVFVLLTTLPLFEGHIANGELFVMGFVLLGWALIAQTPYFKHFSKNQPDPDFFARFRLNQETFKQAALFLVAGVLFGLGILTKVPALFDAVAVALFFWWLWLRQIDFKQLKRPSYVLNQLAHAVFSAGAFAVGLLLPLVASVVYYVYRGVGQDYLQFGLLYNFHYASNWGLPFSQSWLVWLFTLQGKAMVMVGGLLLFSLLSRKLSPSFLFAGGWFLLALFASLLSNRPYPHYYLQVFPPLALLVGVAVDSLRHWWSQYHPRVSFLDLTASGVLIMVFILVLKLLQVGGYSVSTYYDTFFKLVTGRITASEYRHSFNHLMADNYAAAPILATTDNNLLFIWGTNPSLYALTGTVPVGRFTVAFHIEDLNAFPETYAAVTTTQPEYIVIMNDYSSVFPELQSWIKHNYIPNTNFEHFVIWKKQTSLP